jgi:hypothetical protein
MVVRSKTVTGSFQSTRGEIRNINIEIKSPRPNYRRNQERKKESKLDSFENLEEHWSNGYRTRSLFRTSERRTDGREKKTIETTERTTLEDVMSGRDTRVPEFLL